MLYSSNRKAQILVKRIIIAITGATGAIYGLRLLEVLQPVPDLETHLVMSGPGKQTIVHETGRAIKEVESLADFVYSDRDIGAAISSGSFRTSGMIIAPCSIKTLSGIANSYCENLTVRAADVVLKERRKLVLLLRETPLHPGHLRLMLQAAEAGAIIMPPLPAFYHQPQTIDDIVNQTVGRALDQLDLEPEVIAPLFKRWEGVRGLPKKEEV